MITVTKCNTTGNYAASLTNYDRLPMAFAICECPLEAVATMLRFYLWQTSEPHHA